MALHVGHNCNPWDKCDVCGAEVEPPYRQRTDVCAMCRQGFTICRCRHQLRESRENMAKLIGAYETVDHREVNGWTVTLFRNLSHDGTQPHGSFSATVREGVSGDSEGVLSFYGETREDVEREVLRIVGVSPLDAAAIVEENKRLRGVFERAVIERDALRETVRSLREQAKRADDDEATTLANSDLATTEQVVRALRAENARLRECNDAMREPMRRLREAANMPAQGESAVVGEVLARLADRSHRLDKIAAAAALVETTVQRYFDQHGPSCDEHADEPDHTCPTCCIDIDASDAISGLKFWSEP